MVSVADNAGGKLWYAARTRSRHEKAASTALTERRVEAFLPLAQVLSQWSDRRKLVTRPYFPGYLFVHIAPEERITVQRIPGIVGLVGARPSQPEPIPDAEVLNLQRLIASSVAVDPYPYLKPGQQVCIRSGPLRGVEGTLIRKAKKHLLVVSVHLLGQAVAAEVPAEFVQGL